MNLKQLQQQQNSHSLNPQCLIHDDKLKNEIIDDIQIIENNLNLSNNQDLKNPFFNSFLSQINQILKDQKQSCNSLIQSTSQIVSDLENNYDNKLQRSISNSQNLNKDICQTPQSKQAKQLNKQSINLKQMQKTKTPQLQNKAVINKQIPQKQLRIEANHNTLCDTKRSISTLVVIDINKFLNNQNNLQYHLLQKQLFAKFQLQIKTINHFLNISSQYFNNKINYEIFLKYQQNIDSCMYDDQQIEDLNIKLLKVRYLKQFQLKVKYNKIQWQMYQKYVVNVYKKFRLCICFKYFVRISSFSKQLKKIKNQYDDKRIKSYIKSFISVLKLTKKQRKDQIDKIRRNQLLQKYQQILNNPGQTVKNYIQPNCNNKQQVIQYKQHLLKSQNINCDKYLKILQQRKYLNKFTPLIKQTQKQQLYQQQFQLLQQSITQFNQFRCFAQQNRKIIPQYNKANNINDYAVQFYKINTLFTCYFKMQQLFQENLIINQFNQLNDKYSQLNVCKALKHKYFQNLNCFQKVLKLNSLQKTKLVQCNIVQYYNHMQNNSLIINNVQNNKIKKISFIHFVLYNNKLHEQFLSIHTNLQSDNKIKQAAFIHVVNNYKQQCQDNQLYKDQIKATLKRNLKLKHILLNISFQSYKQLIIEENILNSKQNLKMLYNKLKINVHLNKVEKLYNELINTKQHQMLKNIFTVIQTKLYKLQNCQTQSIMRNQTKIKQVVLIQSIMNKINTLNIAYCETRDNYTEKVTNSSQINIFNYLKYNLSLQHKADQFYVKYFKNLIFKSIIKKYVIQIQVCLNIQKTLDQNKLQLLFQFQQRYVLQQKIEKISFNRGNIITKKYYLTKLHKLAKYNKNIYSITITSINHYLNQLILQKFCFQNNYNGVVSYGHYLNSVKYIERVINNTKTKSSQQFKLNQLQQFFNNRSLHMQLIKEDFKLQLKCFVVWRLRQQKIAMFDGWVGGSQPLLQQYQNDQ